MNIVITREQVEELLDDIRIKIPKGYIMVTPDGVHYTLKKNQDDKEKTGKRSK